MQKPVIRFLLWILCISIFTPVQAQRKDYYRGYIIHPESDTIEGWVKDRSSGTFLDLYAKIRFKADDALVSRRYSPDEILGYGIDNQLFESVPLYEESAFFKFRYYIHPSYNRTFLRVIARTNDLTYYHWEYLDDDSNYLDYIPLFHREGSDEMVRVTQGILGLKRSRLIEYFWDCPELVLAIEQKELDKIDEVYNFYIEHYARDIR